MFKVTKYPHGTFSWADCASTDAAKGKQFYADLMGWDMEDRPMGEGTFYTMFKQDGETTAAIAPMPPDQKAAGMPSFWNSYVTVDDVDALVDKVKAGGGKVVMPPMDVFDAGRMMVIQDPTGAMVSFWQPKEHIGATLVNTPGALCWNELLTRAVQKAMDFFGPLLGWTFDKMDGMDYWVIMNNGRSNGGIMPIKEEWGEMPPNWSVYFSVKDIDESVAKVVKLGGKVEVPITDAGEVGRFAVISDPQGGVCSLMQMPNPEPWKE